MIAASVSKKQIGKTLLILVAIIVIVVGAVYFIGKSKSGSKEDLSIDGATAEQREAYLLSLGIQVDSTSSIADVGVPTEWDERFSAYNDMLKMNGFDLEGLKGQTVKKCTYTVTNRDDISERVSAVLLIYNDKIVAGHIVDDVNNKLYPLFDVDNSTNNSDAAEEPAEDTILPAEDEEVATNPDDKGTEQAPPDKNSDVETGAYPTD